MTRQRFKATLALSVGIVALMAADAAMAKEPELAFHPAKAWAVGTAPESGEVSTGGTQICSVQTEFNNGFIMKLGGSEKWVETLVMDFRQDSFAPGDTYKVNLTVPGKANKTLSAQASKANVLVVNLKGQKELYHAMRDSSVLDMKLQENNFRFYLTGFTPVAKNFERCMAGGPLAEPEAPVREAQAGDTVNEAIALEEAAKQQAKIEITDENPQVVVAAIPYTEKTKVGGVEVKAKEPVAIDITATPEAPIEEPPQAELVATNDDDTPILMAKQEPEKRRLTEMLDEEINQNPEIAEISDAPLAPPPPNADIKPLVPEEELAEETPEPEALVTQENALAQPEPDAPPVLDGHAVAAAEEVPTETQAQKQEQQAALPAPEKEIPAPEPAAIDITAQPEAPAEEIKPVAVAEATPAPAAAPVKSGMSEETIQRLRAMAAAQLSGAVETPQAPVAETTAQMAEAAPEAGQTETAVLLLDEPEKPMPGQETAQELQTASIDAAITPELTQESERTPITVDLTEAVDAPEASPPPVPVEPVKVEQTPELQIPSPGKAKFTKQSASIEADFTDLGQQQPAEEEPFTRFEKRAPGSVEVVSADNGTDPAVMKKIVELESAVARLQNENSSLNDELKQSIKESEGERMSVSSENWNLEQATMRFNESERQIRGLGEQIQKERAQCLMEKRDLETQLFDPQITSQEQLARLAELEQQLAAAQAKLSAMGVTQ